LGGVVSVLLQPEIIVRQRQINISTLVIPYFTTFVEDIPSDKKGSLWDKG